MENPNKSTASYQRNECSVMAVAFDFYDITDLSAGEIDRLRRESPEMMHRYLADRPLADCPTCGGRFSCKSAH